MNALEAKEMETIEEHRKKRGEGGGNKTTANVRSEVGQAHWRQAAAENRSKDDREGKGKLQHRANE